MDVGLTPSRPLCYSHPRTDEAAMDLPKATQVWIERVGIGDGPKPVRVTGLDERGVAFELHDGTPCRAPIDGFVQNYRRARVEPGSSWVGSRGEVTVEWIVDDDALIITLEPIRIDVMEFLETYRPAADG